MIYIVQKWLSNRPARQKSELPNVYIITLSQVHAWMLMQITVKLQGWLLVNFVLQIDVSLALHFCDSPLIWNPRLLL